jgi:hypothetical protein
VAFPWKTRWRNAARAADALASNERTFFGSTCVVAKPQRCGESRTMRLCFMSRWFFHSIGFDNAVLSPLVGAPRG